MGRRRSGTAAPNDLSRTVAHARVCRSARCPIFSFLLPTQSRTRAFCFALRCFGRESFCDVRTAEMTLAGFSTFRFIRRMMIRRFILHSKLCAVRPHPATWAGLRPAPVAQLGKDGGYPFHCILPQCRFWRQRKPCRFPYLPAAQRPIGFIHGHGADE